MATLLGIDYGARNIGLAVSDKEEKLAFPHGVIENNNQALGIICNILRQKEVKKVIIGESYNSQKEPNAIMKDVQAFKERLEKECEAECAFEPEFFTSFHAGLERENQKKLDASAAALILQRYLDKSRE